MSDTRAASRRDQIIDEAFDLIGFLGYRALSLTAVAVRCGLTKQGVMHYFPTKAQLLVAILNERDALIEADLLDLLESNGFDRARAPAAKRKIFRDSLMAIVAHMLTKPGLIRLHVVLRAEAIDPRHPANAYFLQRDAATLKWLAERAAPFVQNPLSKARQLLGLLLGLQSQWLQESQSFDLLEEWQRALTDVLP